MGRKKLSLKIDVKQAEFKEEDPATLQAKKGEEIISPSPVLNKVYGGEPNIYLSS